MQRTANRIAKLEERKLGAASREVPPVLWAKIDELLPELFGGDFDNLWDYIQRGGQGPRPDPHEIERFVVQWVGPTERNVRSCWDLTGLKVPEPRQGWLDALVFATSLLCVSRWTGAGHDFPPGEPEFDRLLEQDWTGIHLLTLAHNIRSFALGLEPVNDLPGRLPPMPDCTASCPANFTAEQRQNEYAGVRMQWHATRALLGLPLRPS